MRVCRLISKKCQRGLNSSRLDHYLKKKNLQFFLVKVFVITVKNNFRFKSRNISFINDKMSFWQLLRPVSVVFVTWKDIGLLVRRRSIVDLLVLVKHVLLLTIFVRLKLSQNSSYFPKPIQSVLFRSTLKSPITIRLSYSLRDLLREFVNSSKNISRLVEMGGL